MVAAENLIKRRGGRGGGRRRRRPTPQFSFQKRKFCAIAWNRGIRSDKLKTHFALNLAHLFQATLRRATHRLRWCKSGPQRVSTTSTRPRRRLASDRDVRYPSLHLLRWICWGKPWTTRLQTIAKSPNDFSQGLQADPPLLALQAKGAAAAFSRRRCG